MQVLAAIENQNDPRVLNYTGYSNRKAGRLEIGITYYRKALAIDPNFVLAREYLGEGYVAAGRIDLAKLELNEIKTRAGAGSEEYRDLAKAIATGRQLQPGWPLPKNNGHSGASRMGGRCHPESIRFRRNMIKTVRR